MARWIAQSTTVTIAMGPFLASSDGVTAQTALGAITVRVMRGSTWNARSSATAAAHQENGFYSVELNATDTGTLGRIRLASFPASTVPVWEDFMVVPTLVYNALVDGTDQLHVDVIQWLGTGVATPTVAGVPEVDPTHWNGTALPTPHTAGYPIVTVKDGTGTGEINTTAGAVAVTLPAAVAANVTQWDGAAVATPTVAGVPEVDVTHWLGTAAQTPTTAGVPNVHLVSASTAAEQEIADVVLDRSITEPSAVWTWPASLRSVIAWLGALSRNKVTQTATTQTVRNDADSATIATSTHADDGTTHTRGEFS